MKITNRKYKRDQERVSAFIFYRDLQKQKKRFINFLLLYDQKWFKDDLSNFTDNSLSTLPMLISKKSKQVLWVWYNQSKQNFKTKTEDFSINWWLKNDEATIYINNLTDLHLSQNQWSISRTTKLWMIDIIADWINEWSSYWEIAKDLRKTDPMIFSKSRAELIAIQEVWRAYEYGNYLPMKELKDKWEQVKKKWITAWDEKVRNSHVKNWADWWIDINVPFSWTQTNISPDWFRCRCATIYDIDDTIDEGIIDQEIELENNDWKQKFKKLNTWDKDIETFEIWDISKNNVDSLNDTFFTETDKGKMFWKTFIDESLVNKEKLSSIINNELGVYSPKTHLIKWKTRWILNEFIDWESISWIFIKKMNDKEFLKYRSQRIRLWAIDMITGQTDRHIWNIMMDKSKNIIAIDNDMIFRVKWSEIHEQIWKIRESFFEWFALREATPTKLELYQWLLSELDSIDETVLSWIVEDKLWLDIDLWQIDNLNSYFINNKKKYKDYLEEEIDYILN